MLIPAAITLASCPGLQISDILELATNLRKDHIVTEKALTRALDWLKLPTSAFTLKTLLGLYAKQTLTPRSLNVKLGPRHNYHKGRAAIRHYANQTARPL